MLGTVASVYEVFQGYIKVSFIVVVYTIKYANQKRLRGIIKILIVLDIQLYNVVHSLLTSSILISTEKLNNLKIVRLHIPRSFNPENSLQYFKRNIFLSIPN